MQFRMGNPGKRGLEDVLRNGNPIAVLLWDDEGAEVVGTLHWALITGIHEYEYLGGGVSFANQEGLSWDEFVKRWSFDGMLFHDRTTQTPLVSFCRETHKLLHRKQLKDFT